MPLIFMLIGSALFATGAVMAFRKKGKTTATATAAAAALAPPTATGSQTATTGAATTDGSVAK